MTVGELKQFLAQYPDDMLCVDAPCVDTAMFDIQVEEYAPADDQRYYGYGNEPTPKMVLKFS